MAPGFGLAVSFGKVCLEIYVQNCVGTQVYGFKEN